MTFDVTAGLLGLVQIVRKLKELTEWEKLERQEARLDLPPSFRLSNHVEEELRIQRAAFISTAMNLHEALANLALTASLEQRERWQRRLRQLEREVQVLGPTERFISA
jgi:hypothetical protein